MTICGIIGDSIALGIALAHPGCDTSAKVGRSTHAILSHPLPRKHYDFVIISAGSNNPRDARLYSQLQRIRKTVNTDKVVWIEPLNSERARQMVRSVALQNGDQTQSFTRSNDGIHPRSYSALWKLVDRKINYSVLFSHPAKKVDDDDITSSASTGTDLILPYEDFD